MDESAIAAELPLEQGLIYLNHAAVGPWPRRTVQAIRAFAEENLRRACSRAQPWLEGEQEARHRLAALLATGVDDVALVKNTSEGVSLVAAGLDWRPGDNVVLPAGEFPSNRAPWTALSVRGVAARLVDLYAADDPVAALLAHCDDRTRLLAVSAVQYDTGLRLDLETLAAACRHRGILLLIDAIQALGAVAIDWRAVDADFVTGSCHKWLLAPEGVGYLHVRADQRPRLELQQFGWRMGPRPFDFERPDWAPAASGRRFEPGTLNTLGLIATAASISLLEEVGLAAVEARVLERSGWLIDALGEVDGIDVVTPRDPAARAGIVALRLPDLARSQALLRALKQQRIVAAVRGGLLRLSPHFHTPIADLERCVAVIEAWLWERRPRRE